MDGNSEMTWKYTCWLIQSDLNRHFGFHGWGIPFFKGYGIPGFRCVFWYRICYYLRTKRDLRLLLFIVARWFYFRNQYRFGISIPYDTKIGSGFYVGHYGGIFVSSYCEIGSNVNISQDVTLGGVVKNGVRMAAQVGDRVYIAPGVKAVGAVVIGSDSAIGSNCVVTKDVPDRSTVVGVPGRVISQEKGSKDYINNINYHEYRE